MDNFTTQQDNQAVCNRICNLALITLSILAVPAAFASVIRTLYIGWHWVMSIHIAGTIALVILAIYRHSIPFHIRAGFIVLLLTIVGLTGLIKFGLISGATPTLVVAPILATFFFGTRLGLLQLAITIISMSFIAKGFVNGTIRYHFDITDIALLPSTWITYILVALGSIGTVVAATIMMRDHLLNSLVTARNNARNLEQKVAERTHELEQAKTAAEALARTDPMTGLNNRRAFFEYADIIDNQSRRYQHPYVFIMLDIDHFKLINDKWGHDAGDITIKSVGKMIQENLRDTDILGRIGGEEFAVILPETGTDGALHLAERIRHKIEEMEIDTPKGIVNVTTSLGLSFFDNTENTLEEMMANADSALYQAKNTGRNKIECYIQPS